MKKIRRLFTKRPRQQRGARIEDAGVPIRDSLIVFALSVTSAEMQTGVWFAMTIIGVVIFSGKFFSWPRLEQTVAVLVLLGLGWLLVRTGE